MAPGPVTYATHNTLTAGVCSGLLLPWRNNRRPGSSPVDCFQRCQEFTSPYGLLGVRTEYVASLLDKIRRRYLGLVECFPAPGMICRPSQRGVLVQVTLVRVLTVPP